MSPVVLCLAPTGLAVARAAAAALAGELFLPEGMDAGRAEARGEGGEGGADAATRFPRAVPFLREVFRAGRPIVGVCAAGILIRAVAPCLGGKTDDPPLLAGAEDGSCWIPLLGGHVGANAMASRLAAALGGRAALTTAGDLRFGAALDAPPAGWRLVHRERAGPLTARLLAGGGLAVAGSDRGLAPWLAAFPARAAAAPDVLVGPGPVPAGVLGLVPRRAALGVGCVRDCPPAALRALATGVLARADIAPAALAGVFSIDRKADEPAVIELARSLDAPLRFLSARALEAETPRLANPSETVYRAMGCHGVAEAAALAGAGAGSELRVAKVKTSVATCALALAPAPVVHLPGRRRGRLLLVSAGPAGAEWRTGEAAAMIAEAEELVGYGRYLEQLGPLAAGKPARAFALGEEEARCRHALDRAGAGRVVALVSSGDAGIYAMAALVHELVDRSPAGSPLRSVELVVGPGVTAATAAAARVGAPLGHDFCAISLSDLLTPRALILKRIEAAAAGDLVIAFYNPVSARRRTLLEAAREILLRTRPPATPVAVVRAAGRAEESVRHVTLDALASDLADMHCTVLVGSSRSRRLQTPDGARIYTPRGYLPEPAPALRP